MELDRFSAEQWDAVRERLRAKEGGWTEAGFSAWLAAPGTEEKLVMEYGEDWVLEQALTFATGGPLSLKRTGKRTRKRLAEAIERDEKRASEPVVDMPVTVEELERRVEARYQSYLSAYEGITLNDMAMLRDLADAEVEREHFSRLMKSEMLREFPDANRIGRYSTALKEASARMQSIQKMLGIDKRTRDDSAEKRSDLEEVLGVIEAAGEFVEGHSVLVTHCNILIGQYVTAFLEFSVTITHTCPMCRAEVKVERKPTEEDLRAFEPEWIAEDESKYRYSWGSQEGRTAEDE